MRYLLCALLIISSAALWAGWDWAKTIDAGGMARAWDIACDTQSNAFVAGDFTDSLLVGNSSYPGFGLSDSYVIKYDAQGEVLWAKTFGSINEDVALGVATDAQGNCYVAGYFVETFTCGGQTVSSMGMWDVYVLKLDSAGNLLWLRTFGSTLNDIGYGLAVNASGQVFVAGWFASTIKFPGGDSITSAGGSDVFCTSWDTNGNFLWADSGGTPGVDYGYEVACDDAGNAYVTGTASEGSVFGSFTLASGGMYVVKWNAVGDVVWVASSVNTAVINIAVSPYAGVSQYGMVTGRVAGVGSIGAFPFSSINGTDDAYWAKFDANTGAWIDMQYYGGTEADKGKDVDCEFFPAFVANYEGQAAFGGVNYNSFGESDVMLGYGTQLQFTSAGGANMEISTCLKVLPNATIVVAGWHFGDGLFGSNYIDTGNVSNQNAFIACYNPSTEVQDEVISSPSILQISPNPFRESVTISLDKAGSGENPEIYNLKGQRIQQLSNPTTKGDLALYTWDGRDSSGKPVAAGIYLIKGNNYKAKLIKL